MYCVPKLSDFGLARELQAKPNQRSFYSTQSNVVMGTLAYMAPEFLRNRKMTTKTDVYSFGVVLLELFTGLAADDPTLKQRTLVKGGGLQMLHFMNTMVYVYLYMYVCVGACMY